MYWNKVIGLVLDKAGWLTLTWDVLKWDQREAAMTNFKRLTLTWDVLKYRTYLCDILGKSININMRCIEIVFDVVFFAKLRD